MNKSLEALDKFKLLYESKCKEQPKNLIGFDMCYITIKQDLERYHNALQEQYDYSTCRCYDELLFRCKHLENENQDLKDKNTKMFVELSNTITAINKFLEYLDKDKTKSIPKYSIKETFLKIVDKVVEQ